MCKSRVRIQGALTTFDGAALTDGDVVLLDRSFNPVCQTKTGQDGRYELIVAPGRYMALAGVKDYTVNYLEYWAWHIPVFQDLEVNMRNGGLEVYAMNAFVPQGAYPQICVYFRPMSLQRYKQNKATSSTGQDPAVNIVPDLSKADVEAFVNEIQVEVLYLNRVLEYCGDKKMAAYLVSLAKPQDYRPVDYNKVHLVIKDPLTGEQGEGVLFWKPAQLE